MKNNYKLLLLITFLLSSLSGFAQLAASNAKGTITGKVTTVDGKPAASVSIIIVENNKKTVTNEEGIYTFNGLKAGDYTVKTSYVGLQVQSQKTTVTDGQSVTVDFTLSENSSQLDEIVI